MDMFWIGFVFAVDIMILFLGIYLVHLIAERYEHRMLVLDKKTNLSYEEFKDLNKQIKKNLNLTNFDFKIVLANSKVVLKIKKNYFEFFQKDNSLAFLFNEEKLIENKLLNI